METLDPAEPCWNQRRKELLRWLRRHAPPLADVYQVTVLILYELDLPARRLLVAHGVREIGNNLPAFLGYTVRGQVQYKQHLDRLLPQWRRAALPIGSIPLASTVAASVSREPVRVPAEIVDHIALVLGDHEKGSVRARDKAIALFTALRKGEGASEVRLMPVIRQWMDVCEWFVGNAHLGSSDNVAITEELRGKFDLFEGLLHTLAGSFFDVVEELDEILAQTNC